MKVLTILSKLEMGGIEKTLLSCLPYLKSEGIEIFVLCDIGGKLQPEYEKLGAKIIDFKGYKRPFLEDIRLRQVLASQKFDIVHSRAGHTSGGFAKVCQDFGIPLLVSIHNEKAMFRNSWVGKPILGYLRQLYLDYHKKLTAKYATFIVGHSLANLDYYKDIPQIYKEKLKVLYNGIDFGKFRESLSLSKEKQNKLDDIQRSAKKVFIHIGKFKEQKNHSFMIDVFNRLKPKENNYYLILLGEGPLKSYIEEKVRQLNLERNVLFCGMETNIAPYLSISDIFLFPSLYEGFGNVLIEAQYAGVAVAASDIKPHHEATYFDYKLFFFSPFDVDEAVSKVTMLMNFDLPSVKEKAYDFAAEFSIKNMVDNLLSLYNNSYKNT